MKSSHHYATAVLPFIVVAAVLFWGCSTGTSPQDDEDNASGDKAYENIRHEPVPADGRLEAVTWNLQWYGVPSEGPEDEELQTMNILQVIDSLRADLYAFQEVNRGPDLARITTAMDGYRGFVAGHIEFAQRTAFVFNTAAIDSIDAGAITEGQNRDDWAGRLPLYFKFEYNADGATVPVYAVVIHAKAFSDQDSYQRRKKAAEDLYNYLVNQQPDARIIFLGDYNDDVDQSIYNGEPSPYQLFVENDHYFRVVTRPLSDAGISSTVSNNYPDIIDHITISDELFEATVPGSEAVYQKAGDFIPDYGRTTSDHYPVWAKFDFSK